MYLKEQTTRYVGEPAFGANFMCSNDEKRVT